MFNDQPVKTRYTLQNCQKFKLTNNFYCRIRFFISTLLYFDVFSTISALFQIDFRTLAIYISPTLQLNFRIIHVSLWMNFRQFTVVIEAGLQVYNTGIYLVRWIHGVQVEGISFKYLYPYTPSEVSLFSVYGTML